MSDASADLQDPRLFFNRELSLLEFQRRVLEQAKDPEVPLLERLRFLGISATNLDEFFEVRLAAHMQRAEFGISHPGVDGLTPQETVARISVSAHELVAEQYRVLNEVLLPALEAEEIRVLRRTSWTKKQRTWIKEYFEKQVLPVLTPMGLDPAHPFPKILNKSLNFIVSVAGPDAFERDTETAIVHVPRTLPRLIALPPDIGRGPYDFVMLSSIIHAHIEAIFPGMRAQGCFQFRVTRNGDLWVDEEEVDDLLSAVKGELPGRKFSAPVRLEVSDNCPEEMASFLLDRFELTRESLYEVDGPVNLHRLVAIVDLVDRPELKYRSFVPNLPRKLDHGQDLFEALRKSDVVLHHPYDSFGPVLELLRQAAADPDVLAIKQTLYRVGNDSPIIEALIEAARAGKEVTALVEVRARFDEEENIHFATRLQEVGANVVYGIVGYKAHSKMLVIVRRESDELRRYVHLGTGNYHMRTTRQYTDISLMSASPELGEDLHRIFMQLTGLGQVQSCSRIIQSPFHMHEWLLQRIATERDNALAGREARIVAKLNSLSEPRVITALYEASQAGVEIDLIVRGICCLRPGVPGVSERIRVRSIVGRFLEHSRVYHFHAGGEHLTYCSSADWMPRNLLRRVEVVFPIDEPALARRVVDECLETALADNCQSWILREDGSYERSQPGSDPALASQDVLLARIAQLKEEPRSSSSESRKKSGGGARGRRSTRRSN